MAALALCALILLARAAAAQVHELDELRLEQALTMQAEDSLTKERARLLQLGAKVSQEIDSLKLHEPVSEVLTERSLYAMQLNTNLSRVNLQLESLAERHDSLKVQLRTAYDWEISRLLGMLTEQWDEGLVQQLAIYQEERQALGFDLTAAEMRYGPDMTISDRDGPEEIEQKTELMRDKLNMVRQDLERVQLRLAFLANQAALVAELFRRGGAAPRGQSVLRDMRSARLSAKSEGRTAEMESVSEIPARRGRQAAAPGEEAAEAGVPMAALKRLALPAVRGLQLETSRLRARRQEIQQLEAVYVNRIATFEQRRQSLLAGAD